MIKCYLVLINAGFGGTKYFQEKKNAEKFVEEIKNNNKVIKIELEEIIATPREYIEINFSDLIKAD